MPTLTLDDTAVDYDDRGEGPPLLLLAGGSGHAGVFERFASHLAESHRVVAMSSRVASAARPETEQREQRPEVHAEDALGLIEALFEEPPFVFGSSSGAVTALELAARHPEHVRLAVVHEPPLVGLLPDAEHHRAALESVRAIARAHGGAEATKAMAAAMAASGTESEAPVLRRTGDWLDGYAETRPEPPSPELLKLFERIGGLQPTFLEHILVPFATASPDPAALGTASARLAPAAGIDSRGQLPYRTTAALAERLGLPLTEFPGGHLGPVERPRQFAHALKALLGRD